MALLEKENSRILMKRSITNFLEKLNINLARNTKTLGLTPFEDVRELLLRLRPQDNGHNLIRIGADNDGGYLVPDDFNGVSHLLSPGCDLLWAFEADLHSRYGIEFFICDEANKKPNDLPSAGHYVEGFIAGASDYPEYLSIRDWILMEKILGSEKILQIDIEGAEYLSFLSLSRSELEEFRIIVIELHFLEALKNNWSFTQVYKPFFDKLLDSFDVVHLHPNNCCGSWSYRNISFPRLIEVTLHRKDRRLSDLKNASLPNSHDADCVPNTPTIMIDWEHLKVFGG